MTHEIETTGDLIDAIKSTNFTEKKHAHVRVWFRGHNDGNWHLVPGVYRDGFAKDENDRKLKERHLTQDFMALSAPLLRGPKSDAEIYFIQQHYRMPTRLLDWSLNPLAALFFALQPPDKDGKDGCLFVLDAYSFAQKRGSARHVRMKSETQWRQYFAGEMREMRMGNERACGLIAFSRSGPSTLTLGSRLNAGALHPNSHGYTVTIR
jgi:FRG domain